VAELGYKRLERERGVCERWPYAAAAAHAVAAHAALRYEKGAAVIAVFIGL
jgi:hypothetical protein